MRAVERRNGILAVLMEQTQPISASALAAQFSVSRQIIVGDIALMRAQGKNIQATPRGYLLEEVEHPGLVRTIACLHDGQKMERELQICIDHGCSVLDVIVEHPVYGQLTGVLQLHSRFDISEFIKQVSRQEVHALSELTNGIHLHTLECPSEEAYRRVTEELEKEGILLKDES